MLDRAACAYSGDPSQLYWYFYHLNDRAVCQTSLPFYFSRHAEWTQMCRDSIKEQLTHTLM